MKEMEADNKDENIECIERDQSVCRGTDSIVVNNEDEWSWDLLVVEV
jgi:hypothetical protein